MRYPKILIFCPTYEGKDYAIDRWVNNINSFTYPNYRYIIIDNSEGTSYTRKLRERGYNVHHVPRGKNSRSAIANSQNYARYKMLSEGYDYLLSVEVDLYPPHNVIELLLGHCKDIVALPYFIGFKNKVQEFKIPCIFYKTVKHSLGGTRLISLKEANTFFNKGLQEVHGCGLGCTLIRRHIVEKFPFWTDERFTNKHSDVYFYMDVNNAGYKVFVDSDYCVEHDNSDWQSVNDR